jgi:membrane protease YdiL (CAAX protease family)
MIFLLIFGVQSALNFIVHANSALTENSPLLSALVSTIAAIILIKSEGSKFNEYGFRLPGNSLGYILFSFSLALIYIISVIFLQGAFSTFEVLPVTASLSDTSLIVLMNLMIGIGVETVFRGYILTKLDKLYRFFPAAMISSFLYVIYMFAQVFRNADVATSLLTLLLTLFAESFFLCILFVKTRTLLCPIVYFTSVASLQRFTPLVVTAREYEALFVIVTYVFLVLVVQLLIVEA